MTLDEKLVAAVSPVVAIVRPASYLPAPGEEVEEYCTYNSSELPRVHASGAPRRLLRLYQLHYYRRDRADPKPTLNRLKHEIFASWFTYPSITDVSDEDGLHWVLEFEGSEVLKLG